MGCAAASSIQADALLVCCDSSDGEVRLALSVLHHLRQCAPDLRIEFVSSSPGVALLAQMADSIVCPSASADFCLRDFVHAVRILEGIEAPIIVTFGNLSVLSAAKVLSRQTVLVTRWFPAIDHLSYGALAHADYVLFLEKRGLFTEPPSHAMKIEYFGPVHREFAFPSGGRNAARISLGIASDEALILALPGTNVEGRALMDLAVESFSRIVWPSKRLLACYSPDQFVVEELTSQCIKIHRSDLDTFLMASDVALIAADYHLAQDAMSVGIPTITISHGKRFIDDLFLQSWNGTAFCWLADISPSTLALRIERALRGDMKRATLRDTLRGHSTFGVSSWLVSHIRKCVHGDY